MRVKKIPMQHKFWKIGEKLLEFLDIEPKLIEERFYEIMLEIYDIKEKVKNGELSEDSALKIREELGKELENTDIAFFDPEDYWIFTANYLEDKQEALDVFKHELTHAQSLISEGIPSCFGFHKLKVEDGEKPIAFTYAYGEKYYSLSTKEKHRLTYISLVAVGKPSNGDMKFIAKIKEIYGNERCEEWISKYNGESSSESVNLLYNKILAKFPLEEIRG